MDKDYYFQGRFFETSEEMLEYASTWPNEKLDQETAERLLKTFSKDCVMSIFLLGRKMTNGQMNDLLENIFVDFMIRVKRLDKGNVDEI